MSKMTYVLRRVAHLGGVALLALCVVLVLTPTHSTHATNFPYSVGSAVQQPQYPNIDEPPLIYKDNAGTLWMIYSDGNNNWHRYSASAPNTDMDHLTQQSDAQKPGNFTRSSCNDDRYWIDRGWYDSSTGLLYGTVHIEYCYTGNNQFQHTRRIGLVQSNDNGASWIYDGDIITPTTSLPADAVSTFGEGDQNMLVDTHSGYFYIFYWFEYVHSNNSPFAGGIGAARCPISSTQNGMHMYPGCWQKLDNGSWSQPGLGGQESAIPTLCAAETDCTQMVAWDSALNEYIAMWQGHGIATATDLGSENWSSFDGTQLGNQWYKWVVDDSTQDSNTVGLHFRFYEASCNVVGPTTYREISIGSSNSQLVQDAGYEQQTSRTLASPWSGDLRDTSNCAVGVDVGQGNAHSGSNNSWIYCNGNNQSGSWAAQAQFLAVTPNTAYTLSVWVYNDTGTIGNTATLQVASVPWSNPRNIGFTPSQGGYVQETLHFTTLSSETQISIELGYTAPAGGATGMRIDDWSLTAA